MSQAQAVLTPVASTLRRPAQHSQWWRVRTSLGGHGRGLFGFVITALVLSAAVAAPFLAPHDPLQQQILSRLKPPVWMPSGDPQYLLGADAVGRDLLSRIIWGARISMIIGVASVAIAGVAGTVLGLLAGYFGGWVDGLLMRLVDVWQAVSFLVLAIAVAVVLGQGLVNVVIVLGFTTWITYARIVRAEVLSLRHLEFVQAARLLGASDARIMFGHLLPNVTTSLIIVATQQVAAMILFEASLSFLGLGVQPPTPTWGGMVADGRNYVSTAWWVATLPGLAIVVTVLGINLLGDWLRDFMDPRQKLL